MSIVNGPLMIANRYKTFGNLLIGLLIVAISCGRVNDKAGSDETSNVLSIEKDPDSAEGIKSASPLHVIDTLLAIGNHRLHVRIYKGSGMPILFENGAGDDCSVWDTILNPIARITGATLITYDRAGFGSSSLDTIETDLSKHGVLSGLQDLEMALRLLGYDQQIMIVSHSYGGYYSTLYADKYPDRVRSMVLIDVNHDFYENIAEQEMKAHQNETNEWKKKNMAFYYMAVNLAETVRLMSGISIPENIPVIDLVNGDSFQETEERTKRWIDCHKNFVAGHSKSTGLTAAGCGHYIWLDDPELVILSIAKAYAETTVKVQRLMIYRKALYQMSQSIH